MMVERLSPNQTNSTSLITALAVFFVILAAVSFRPEAAPPILFLALLFLITAYVLLGSSQFRYSATTTSDSETETSESPHPMHSALVIAGLLCLLIFTEINARIFGCTFLYETTIDTQVVFLLAGTLLLGIGLTGWRGTLLRLSLSTVLPIMTLTLIAGALRLWQLGEAVSVLLKDEYMFTLVTTGLNDTNTFRLMMPFSPDFTFSWAYPYLAHNSITILGPSIAAMRLTSAFAGTFTVPALFLLARNLFDRRIAWTAALILATFPPHLHISRIALNNIVDPFFGTLALAFIAAGFRYRRRSSFVIAGLLLAYTQFFYEGGRLLFPPLVFLWIAIVNWRERLVRWRDLLPGAAAFSVLALPVYLTLATNGYLLAPRLDYVAPGPDDWEWVVENTEPQHILSGNYGERVIGVLLQFVHNIDNSPEFYGGMEPMILTPIVPLFLLGILHSLWRWRQRGNQLLLLWMMLGILGIGIVQIALWTIRFTSLFPAIALLMAIGLWYTLPLIVPARRVKQIAIILTLLIAVGQVHYYFGPHLSVYNQQVRYNRDYADAYYRATAYPPGTVVHFVTNGVVWMPYLNVLDRLWQPDLTVIQHPRDDTIQQVIDSLTRDVNHLFFLIPQDELTPDILAALPGIEGPFWSPQQVPRDKQYVMYYLPSLAE